MFHSVLSATPQSHSPIWYICQNTVIPDLLLDIPINPVWECSMHQRTEPKLLAPHQIYARWCLDFWCRTQCRRFAAPWGALWPNPTRNAGTLLAWLGSREVDAAGEKARASWNDLVGLWGSGNFRNLSQAQYHSKDKVKQMLSHHFSEMKMKPLLSAWKCLTLKWHLWWETLRGPRLWTLPTLLAYEANAFP